MDAVGTDVIDDVARHVFGTGTRVAASRLLAMGTGNVAYLVTVTVGRVDRQFVFRFNRGFREDVYEGEATNYARVAAATGVRVPQILTIDRSCTVAPTSYMVMEYLAGDEWTDLCRPDSTGVSPEDKHAIRTAAGRFYADLHTVTRPAAAGESVSYLLLGLAQYAAAMDAGHLVVDLDKVAECERVVRADTAANAAQLSLCMFDGEIYFERRDGRFELAFVCDLEWVGFANRLADLTGQTLPADKLVMVEEPVMTLRATRSIRRTKTSSPSTMPHWVGWRCTCS
jgi:hypothetical protein